LKSAIVVQSNESDLNVGQSHFFCGHKELKLFIHNAMDL